jgi:hypothetical protein
VAAPIAIIPLHKIAFGMPINPDETSGEALAAKTGRPREK